ncbi:hypothetical protein QAD02_015729 [Eretmocerus hayati]|uniref:Uncharacterized protein n=1 Tax=Eretmocerus hayati TaxID=131215 RepID=A0ACC2P9H5_9HYME|nr:hypothetical protein QAD02_015729 [Eretmocerus hayati]
MQKNFINTEPLRGNAVLPVDEYEYRYVAHIAYKDKKSDTKLIYTCSGIVITKKHVLTAAHCLLETKAEVDKTRVLVGSSNLLRCTPYTPKSWTTYIDYKEQITNGAKKLSMRADTDLASIELSHEIDESIKPATIALRPVEKVEGGFAEIVGWGLLDDNVLNKQLNRAFVTILSPETCSKKISEKLHKVKRIFSRNICTVANPRVSLTCGDSGGPVVRNNKVIAVNRGTSPVEFEEAERYNVHLYLLHYKQFIDWATKDESVTYDDAMPK